MPAAIAAAAIVSATPTGDANAVAATAYASIASIAVPTASAAAAASIAAATAAAAAAYAASASVAAATAAVPSASVASATAAASGAGDLRPRPGLCPDQDRHLASVRVRRHDSAVLDLCCGGQAGVRKILHLPPV